MVHAGSCSRHEALPLLCCGGAERQKTDIADRFVIIVVFPLSDRPVLLCYKPLKQPTQTTLVFSNNHHISRMSYGVRCCDLVLD
jgi:hypothetical protein